MSDKDPNGLDAHTPGAKLDAGKPRYYLVLAPFQQALARRIQPSWQVTPCDSSTVRCVSAPNPTLDIDQLADYILHNQLDKAIGLVLAMTGENARFLHGVVAVGTYGATKYTPNGWSHVPDGGTRYLDAAMRHVVKHALHGALDDESGLPHLHHVAWCLLAVRTLQLRAGDVEVAG